MDATNTTLVWVGSATLFVLFTLHFAVALFVYRRTPARGRWPGLALVTMGTAVLWVVLTLPLMFVSGMILCTTASYCGPDSPRGRAFFATSGLGSSNSLLPLISILAILYILAAVRPWLLQRFAASPARVLLSAPGFAALVVGLIEVPAILYLRTA